MDYAKLYNALISFRKSNPLVKSKELYTEKHHIVPRCLGGSDDHENLIRLTAREHFIAHRLLAKMYPEERGLVVATVLMGGRLRRGSSKGITELREKISISMSKLSKARWSDPIYRETTLKRMTTQSRIMWSETTFKENMSIKLREGLKRSWSDNTFRTQQSNIRSNNMKNVWAKQDYRISKCLEVSEKWSNVDYKYKVLERHMELTLEKPADDIRHVIFERLDLIYFQLQKEASVGEIINTLFSDYLSEIKSHRNTVASLCRKMKSGWEPLDSVIWGVYVDKRLIYHNLNSQSGDSNVDAVG